MATHTFKAGTYVSTDYVPEIEDSYITFYFTFYSPDANGIMYDRMQVGIYSGINGLEYYSNGTATEVYNFSTQKWLDESYKTIYLPEDVTMDDAGYDEHNFITYFPKMFTRVKQPTLTYDLTTLNLPAGTYTISVIATADGYEDSAPSNTIQYTVEPKKYSIVQNVSNLTTDAPEYITEGETIEVNLTQAAGFTVPESVTVTGAEYEYDEVSATITISNPTDTVTITASGVRIAYPANVAITHATVTQAPSGNFVPINGQATFKFTADTNYGFKTQPAVANATVYDWSVSGQVGTLILRNATRAVEIAVTAERVVGTMTIDGVEQDFDIGTTWADWCSSEYNGDGYMVSGNTIVTADGTKRVEDPDVGAVEPQNIIVEMDYVLVEVMKTLATPTVEIDGTTLNIYDEEGLATEYDILVDGVVKDTVTKPSGYTVTVNFEPNSNVETAQNLFYVAINDNYNLEDAVYIGVTASSSSTSYDPIILTNVQSIGITLYEDGFSSSLFTYAIDGVWLGNPNGFIPITSDCTVTFSVPLLD